jgi:hypothetical protein
MAEDLADGTLVCDGQQQGADMTTATATANATAIREQISIQNADPRSFFGTGKLISFVLQSSRT